MSRIVSFILLIGIVALVGLLSYRVMSAFLLPMFLAILLVVIFQPLHRWFQDRLGGHNRIAAGLTTASILLIVLLPMLLILIRAGNEAYSLATELDQRTIVNRLNELRHEVGLDLPPQPAPILLGRIENTIQTIGDEARGLKLDDRTVELLTELRGYVQEVHGALGLGNDWTAASPFSEEKFEEIRASYAALDESVNILSSPPIEQPAFSERLTVVEDTFAAFRQNVEGVPLVKWLRERANPADEDVINVQERIRAAAGPLALGTGQAVGSFLGGAIVGLGVMIVALYYFLADGPTMVRAIMRLSPLDDRYETQLVTEFGRVSRAVVIATLLSAFVQGLLASVGYFFAGFESVFLLTVITMLFAMIPFIGAATVWGGCCLWLVFVDNRIGAAIGLAIYGALVVSMIDNIIKPWVLHGQSNLHPLLALLSVLGGVQALGPIGIFVGPMVVAFLQALLNILRSELSALDDPPRGTTPKRKKG